MQIINVHKRIINKAKSDLLELITNLSSTNDIMWPYEKWPKMKFSEGLKKGSAGQHGPIKYIIQNYDPEKCIEFRFTEPKGFNGIHKFELLEKSPSQTLIQHSIIMDVTFSGMIKWYLAIRCLHDALIEDAFDKVENHYHKANKSTKWNPWVKLLRVFLK